MPGAKEIRTKISSIKNTQKITRAMKMVAASKMRKAQNRMESARPYAEKILQVIQHVSLSHPQFKHPYLAVRDISRVGFIVITSDRGLCGALNLNLLRMVLKEMEFWKAKNVEQDLCLVGNKADSFFRKFSAHVVGKGRHIDDKTGVADIIGIVKVMLDEYKEGKIDALYLCYNKFINTMIQKPVIQSLLPIFSPNIERKHYWDYIYEPDAEELMDRLLSRYIEMLVFQGIVENLSSEQAARMLAMMNATENAEELIDELFLDYNKARQSAITREISEIVGGANAIDR